MFFICSMDQNWVFYVCSNKRQFLPKITEHDVTKMQISKKKQQKFSKNSEKTSNSCSGVARNRQRGAWVTGAPLLSQRGAIARVSQAQGSMTSAWFAIYFRGNYAIHRRAQHRKYTGQSRAVDHRNYEVWNGPLSSESVVRNQNTRDLDSGVVMQVKI